MMRRKIACLLPALAVWGLAAAATAQAASYQVCSVSGCKSESVFTWPWENSSYAKTRYPIVMAHGMGGFSKIGPVDYFYGIPQDLAKNGARVYVTHVAGMQSSYVRGEDLLRQVQTILAISGASKVNLMAHSQGTIDSRYVAAVMPAGIASVTAVAGPHTGSSVADVVQGARSIPVLGPIAEPIILAGVNGFSAMVNFFSGESYEQNALGGLEGLTTAGAAAFNQQFPAGLPSTATPCAEGAYVSNGIRNYSWSGTAPVTTGVDPSDLFMGATSLLISGPNDGLVPRCASHFGQVLRDDYHMNHFDEVNQVLGVVSLMDTNPKTVFRMQANRLKNAGL